MKIGRQSLDLVVIGRSILSTITNPMAELYRGLINELAHQGHRTIYLAPFDPAAYVNRDMLRSPYCELWTFASVDRLLVEYREAISSADIVMLGADLPETARIAEWIGNEARGTKIYYDTDLARTIESLRHGNRDGHCVSCSTVGAFDLFLSTTGGPTLEDMAKEFSIPLARPLYQCVDAFSHYRTDTEKTYDLGFIGNYKPGREEWLEQLLIEPARHTPNRQFAMAGDGYPETFSLPANLTYLEHLPETNHVDFYNRQSCTLVLNRADRRRMGYSPSRRLLAAAACGVPILSEEWDGLDEFFEPNRDIFCVADEHAVLDVLYHTDEETRRRAGARARERVLSQHTVDRRAAQLLEYWNEVSD